MMHLQFVLCISLANFIHFTISNKWINTLSDKTKSAKSKIKFEKIVETEIKNINVSSKHCVTACLRTFKCDTLSARNILKCLVIFCYST